MLSLAFHDQSGDIAGHLEKIHDALVVRGLPADHAIHTGPLIRREHDHLIRSNYEFFSLWERIVIYYDNGHKEITNSSTASSTLT